MNQVGFGAGAAQESIDGREGLPSAADLHAMALEEQFCARLHAWDRHVDGCGTCLAGEMYLCDAGRELQETVVGVRESIAQYDLRERAPRPMPGPSMIRQAWVAWASFIAPITG